MSGTNGKRGMSLVVNSAEAEAQSRLIAMRMVALTLRLMERWRGLIHDNDSAMIMMAVALINTESLTRTELVEHGVADIKNGVPPDLLRKCNISSVALATGLNRERRGVKLLISSSADFWPKVLTATSTSSQNSRSASKWPTQCGRSSRHSQKAPMTSSATAPSSSSMIRIAGPKRTRGTQALLDARSLVIPALSGRPVCRRADGSP